MHRWLPHDAFRRVSARSVHIPIHCTRICRWGPRIKQEIYDSRINITKRIVSAINKLPSGQRPSVLVSTSAVGYYGVSTSETFDESSRPGSDFLAKVCQDWEAEAQKADSRVVILRSGIILAKNGGALGKMVPVFLMFGGAIRRTSHHARVLHSHLSSPRVQLSGCQCPVIALTLLAHSSVAVAVRAGAPRSHGPQA